MKIIKIRWTQFNRKDWNKTLKIKKNICKEKKTLRKMMNTF